MCHSLSKRQLSTEEIESNGWLSEIVRYISIAASFLSVSDAHGTIALIESQTCSDFIGQGNSSGKNGKTDK